jgi:hypothetical protein
MYTYISGDWQKYAAALLLSKSLIENVFKSRNSAVNMRCWISEMYSSKLIGCLCDIKHGTGLRAAHWTYPNLISLFVPIV